MICISSNVRGLGGGPKFRSLKYFILNNKEDVYFFQETMNLQTKSCEIILRILKYWECCVIDVVGLFGCLVVVWNPKTCFFKPFMTCDGILLEGKGPVVDLNLTLHSFENQESVSPFDPLDDYFLDLFKKHQLVDIFPSKITPTWKRKQGGEGVSKRLDCFLMK